MPRAPRLRPKAAPASYDPSTGKFSRRKVDISKDGAKELIRLSGLQDRPADQPAMLKAVETALSDHYWYIESLNTAPSEKSRLKSVRPLLSKIRDVISDIENLDWWTKLRVNSRLGIPTGSLHEVPDLRVLRRIEAAISVEVLSLQSDAKDHRRRNYALRHTVMNLAGIFKRYRTNASGSWRDFVSAALLNAGISHPDPIDQRTRFDRLVLRRKGTGWRSLTDVTSGSSPS